MGLRSPQPINADFLLDEFDCGNDPLNKWLKERALSNHLNDSTKTQVVVTEDNTVAGFYSLCAGDISHVGAPGKLRRNRPDPIPVIILARLGVDKRFQGMGLGRSLVKHAYSAAFLVSESIGAVCLVVHAIDDDVVAFYQALGFDPFPKDHLTLFRKFH